jgi:cytochrome bd-I ubiquinol oxidase subunit X
MWYFSWILGTGLALTFGVLNAIWFEIMDPSSGEPEPAQPGESPSAPKKEP